MSVFSVVRVSWEEGQELLRPVRFAVFVEEQSVPPELEWNEGDDECEHVVAKDRAGRPIGAGRIDPTGRIGRMAVLRSSRGLGVGAALLRELLEMAAERGLVEVFVHAQVRAVGFYEAHGFLAEGDEFQDAGIPHRLMRRALRTLPRLA